MEKTLGLGSGTGFWLMNLFIEEVYFTPEIATEVLDKHNVSNRDINRYHVDFLADQMTRGVWIDESGIPILFDTKMNFVDGQQRLSGVVQSGIPRKFLVISGVDERAFQIYDTQRTRTAADTFKIRGHFYHTQLAAITKRYLVMVRDSTSYRESSKRLKITPADQLREYEDNKDTYDELLQQAIKYNKSQNILTTTDYCGYMTYLIKYKGREEDKVHRFFNQFAGIEKCENDVIEVARRKLTNARNSNKFKKNKRGTVEDYIKSSYIATAWNAFLFNKNDMEGIKFDEMTQFL